MGLEPSAGAGRDRNLIFGVFAVQNHFLTPAQLVQVSAVWASNPSLSLGETLVNQGMLTEKVRGVLDSAVAVLIEQHQTEAAVLEALGGPEAVHQSFAGSIILTNQGLQCSLASFGGDTPCPSAPAPEDRLDDFQHITIEHPGRYQIKGEQGRGGIGRVLMAFDEHIGRDVAIKELLADSGGGGTPPGQSPFQKTGAMARFLREARITGQLEHPSIVPVYEIARRSDGSIYYSMKLLRGKNLASILKQSPGLHQRLHLSSNFIAVCQAMAYAHSKGVIHRDLKPANVMVGEFGETIVIDWGLAKRKGLTEEAPEAVPPGGHLIKEIRVEQTMEGQTIGTPSYMSPEQAEGRIGLVDERSDVWSLGAMLYEILTGAPPFTGELAFEVMAKVIKDPVTPVTEREPAAPPEYAAICEKCLRKDRESRYADARELAAAMVEAEREMVEKREREARQNMAESYLILARWAKASAQLAKADVYCAKSLTIYDSIAARLILNDIRLAGDPGSGFLTFEGHNRRVTALRFAPGSGTIATTGQDNTVQLWDPPAKLRHSLEGPPARTAGLCFSRDGKMLAAGGEDGTLRIWDAASGKRLRLIKAHASTVSALEFSPLQDNVLASAGLDKTIRLWNVYTGMPVLQTEEAKFPAACLCFSPTQNFLAAGTVNSAIKLYDLEAKKIVRTIEIQTLPVNYIAFTPDGKSLISTSIGKEHLIRVWDVFAGESRSGLPHKGPVIALALAPSGKVLASATKEEGLKVWDIGAGEVRYALKGHAGNVNAFAFSPDEKILASGGDDATVRLWDLETGKFILTLKPHNNKITFLAFAPGGNLLLSTSTDGVIKMWPLVASVMTRDAESLLQEAERRRKLKVIGMDLYEWIPESGKVQDLPLVRPF